MVVELDPVEGSDAESLTLLPFLLPKTPPRTAATMTTTAMTPPIISHRLFHRFRATGESAGDINSTSGALDACDKCGSLGYFGRTISFAFQLSCRTSGCCE